MCPLASRPGALFLCSRRPPPPFRSAHAASSRPPSRPRDAGPRQPEAPESDSQRRLKATARGAWAHTPAHTRTTCTTLRESFMWNIQTLLDVSFGGDYELVLNPPTPCQIGKHPPAPKKIRPARKGRTVEGTRCFFRKVVCFLALRGSSPVNRLRVCMVWLCVLSFNPVGNWP